MTNSISNWLSAEDIGGGRMGFTYETYPRWCVTEIAGSLKGEHDLKALFRAARGDHLWVVSERDDIVSISLAGRPVPVKLVAYRELDNLYKAEGNAIDWPDLAMPVEIGVAYRGDQPPAPVDTREITPGVESAANTAAEKIAGEIVERINAVRRRGYHCVPHVSLQGNVLTPEQKALIPPCLPTKELVVDKVLAAAAALTLDDWEAHPEHWARNGLKPAESGLTISGHGRRRHLSADGTTPDERLRRAEAEHFDRYPSKRWDGYGEVFTAFAADSVTAAERAVENWLNSFNHCCTLMDGGILDADCIGVAVRERSPGQFAACAWFGEFNDYWERYPRFFTW